VSYEFIKRKHEFLSRLLDSDFERSEFEASNVVYINTWATRGRPWNVAVEVGCVRGLAPTKRSACFLDKVKAFVIGLPSRISVPLVYSDLSLPRYYMVKLRLVEEWFRESDPLAVHPLQAVEDIVGIRCDLTPTKWGYRLGYWHPQCQLQIARAIAREIKALEKQVAEKQEAQP
jgi:hypothetical protein